MDTDDTSLDPNNSPDFQYDGEEFLKVIESQRNSALTQAAQLTAVVTRLHEDLKQLQRENDQMRRDLEANGFTRSEEN